MLMSECGSNEMCSIASFGNWDLINASDTVIPPQGGWFQSACTIMLNQQ